MDQKTKKLKIGIYNPYFDSFGGGERYVLTLAEHWSKTHDVSVFWNTPSFLSEATARFGLNLSKVKIVPNIFGTTRFVKKLIESASYDLIFFLSDGSVPTSLARYNILHFQVPFRSVFMSPWKAMRYQSVVVNSEFTKEHLDHSFSIPVSVIYPPVDIDEFVGKKKTKTILSVGRFNGLYGAKKQDVLIESFIAASKRKPFSGWKLVLAGGCLETDRAYVEMLKQQAKGYPIEFMVNCSFKTLKMLYETANIYWHAAGFGETRPENMEHFGITTVEAMAAGSIPVVYNAGGQPEIVTHNKNGYLWTTKEELINLTEHIITNEKVTMMIRKEAVKNAERFSKVKFGEAFDELLQFICN